MRLAANLIACDEELKGNITTVFLSHCCFRASPTSIFAFLLSSNPRDCLCNIGRIFNPVYHYEPANGVPKIPTASSAQTARKAAASAIIMRIFFAGSVNFLAAESTAIPALKRRMPMTIKSFSFQFHLRPSTPVPIVSCNAKGIRSTRPVPMAVRTMLLLAALGIAFYRFLYTVSRSACEPSKLMTFRF